METPGLEVVTSNGWGSDGLIHILMLQEGRLEFLPTIWCKPVCTCELEGRWRGVFNYFCRFHYREECLMRWTAFGKCFLPMAILLPVIWFRTTGDARDEVLVWDNRELWIYTQDDNPRMGNTYDPDRIPLHNHSMHQMNRSLRVGKSVNYFLVPIRVFLNIYYIAKVVDIVTCFGTNFVSYTAKTTRCKKYREEMS